MKVWQAGFKNVVALMGSSLSEEQEILIVDAVGSQGKVILMLDGDKNVKMAFWLATNYTNGIPYIQL